jgi:hypothetical protein
MFKRRTKSSSLLASKSSGRKGPKGTTCRIIQRVIVHFFTELYFSRQIIVAFVPACRQSRGCAWRTRPRVSAEAVRHEQDISNAGRYKLVFAEICQCKPVLLGLSLAGNLVKPLLSLYGTKWRERGYGLWGLTSLNLRMDTSQYIIFLPNFFVFVPACGQSRGCLWRTSPRGSAGVRHL